MKQMISFISDKSQMSESLILSRHYPMKIKISHLFRFERGVSCESVALCESSKQGYEKERLMTVIAKKAMESQGFDQEWLFKAILVITSQKYRKEKLW